MGQGPRSTVERLDRPSAYYNSRNKRRRDQDEEKEEEKPDPLANATTLYVGNLYVNLLAPEPLSSFFLTISLALSTQPRSKSMNCSPNVARSNA